MNYIGMTEQVPNYIYVVQKLHYVLLISYIDSVQYSVMLSGQLSKFPGSCNCVTLSSPGTRALAISKVVGFIVISASTIFIRSRLTMLAYSAMYETLSDV